MKSFSRILVFIGVVVIYQSCNFNRDKCGNTSEKLDIQTSSRKSDSINLRNLLITIYKWHEKIEAIDYDYILYKNRAVGLIKLDSAIDEMKKTDFFSEEFLTNYKLIGQKADME